MKTVIFEAIPDDGLLHSISSIQPQSLSIDSIPSAWERLATADKNLEIHPVNSQILTALCLQSHSDIWAWLETQVTQPAQHLAKLTIPELIAIDPTKIPDNWMPNTWILPLFQSLQAGHLASSDKRQFSLAAKQFFPGSNALDYVVPYHAYNPIQHVEAAVMSWLQFHPRPGMTLCNSRSLATFISVVRKAFRSSNFLYLNYVQHLLKNFHPYTTRTKMHQISNNEWEELALELKNHPLASPMSHKSLVLEHLKEFLWTVSSLPLAKPTEMSARYQKAVEVGGEAGVQLFAPFVGQVYVST